MAGEGLDAIALEERRTSAERRVGDEALALDERRVGFAVPGRNGVVDDARAVRRVPAILDPGDLDPERAAADVDEIERFGAFAAGVGEHDRDVGRELAAVGVDDALQHVAGRAAAGEADDGRARNAVRAAGWLASGRRDGDGRCRFPVLRARIRADGLVERAPRRCGVGVGVAAGHAGGLHGQRRFGLRAPRPAPPEPACLFAAGRPDCG